MTDPTVPAIQHRRPLGVVVVAIVQFGRAGLLILQLVRFTFGGHFDWLHASTQIPDPAPGTVAYVLSQGLGVILVAASITVGIGLLASRRWAWVGAIIMSGLSLAFALGTWWANDPTYVGMLINIVAVFYLNQRDVRAVFDDVDDAGLVATAAHDVDAS